MDSTPPQIFSRQRRAANRLRMRRSHGQAGGGLRTNAARYVIDDMVDDVLERLGFVQLQPECAVIMGDWTGQLARALQGPGCSISSYDPAPLGDEKLLDEERPLAAEPADFIACLGLLDTVNDLPGSLIHLREALRPDGLAIASFIGSGSLPTLRNILLEADGDRPAARVHPMVDVRAAAQLLQRAGWSDPVVDSHKITVRYGSLTRLIGDLRDQGFGNALISVPPTMDRAAFTRAQTAFATMSDDDGRVTEQFEIITLSGRRK